MPLSLWSYDFTGKFFTPHIGGVNIHEHKDFKKKKLIKGSSFKDWLDLIIVNISENSYSI